MLGFKAFCLPFCTSVYLVFGGVTDKCPLGRISAQQHFREHNCRNWDILANVDKALYKERPAGRMVNRNPDK